MAHSAESCAGVFRQQPLDLTGVSKINDEIYQAYDVNDIARAIVQRWRKNEIATDELRNQIRRTRYEESKKTTPGWSKYFLPNEVDLRSDSQIILFFHPESIGRIAAEGFKNIHQTGTSNGGTGGFKNRAAFEDAFTGLALGLSEKARELRPKSAFVNITAPIELSPAWSNLFGYGAIGAVMKEHIKDRSLVADRDTYLIGHRLVEETGWNLQALDDIVGTFDRGTVGTSDNDHYYEALIYGSVTMADVESFSLVHEHFRSQYQMNNVIRRLRTFQKPIDIVEQQMINGRLQIVKRRRAYDPPARQ